MTFARIRALVIVGALALAALIFVVAAITKDRQTHTTPVASCPNGAVAANLKLPDETKDIKINVYNATDQAGLAGTVANDFRGRKFTVGQVGNDPQGKRVDGVAVLRYGPKAVGAAWVLRAYFLNEADLQLDLKRADDAVDVVLGAQFKQLATLTEMHQALTQAGAAQLPPGTCDSNIH